MLRPGHDICRRPGPTAGGGCATRALPRLGSQGRAGETLQCRSAALPRLGSQSRDAFTLIELLVVMAIMAVLAGITAASYAGIARRHAREGAREDIMGVLRQARVSAVDSGRGAIVRIDPASRSIYGISTEVIGAWHFEEVNGGVTPGARRYDGTISGGPTVVSGKLGLALNFDGTGDYVDCGNAPIWNQTTGIRLEAWVWPAPGTAAGNAHIISKTDGAEGYFAGVEYDGAGQVMFEAGAAYTDATGTPGGIFLQTPGSYAEGGWYHVAFECDGFEGRLYVNGVQTAVSVIAAPPALIIPARGRKLEIGRGDVDPSPGDQWGYFRGRIDEPRVLSIAGGEGVTLPERVPLLTSDEVVHFDPQGFLDLAYHTGDVWVAVGDPYQTASLDVDSGATLTLRNANPFPSGGGYVMFDDELIPYSGAAGLTITAADPLRSASAHVAGDTVYFARVLTVGRSGMVTKKN